MVQCCAVVGGHWGSLCSALSNRCTSQRGDHVRDFGKDFKYGPVRKTIAIASEEEKTGGHLIVVQYGAIY